ncbi:MAG: PilZ domain-containing protein [Sphingomicrobium sp.]
MNIRAKIYGGASAAEESLLRSKKPKGAKADTLQSIAVPRETIRSSNNRAEDRHRLTDERARITHNGRDLDVELINLSGGGAMVAGRFRPLLWDRVDLHLGNHGTIECAVRWIREPRVGLEFAHETRLDWPSDQVATVLRHVIERTFPHVSFPHSEQPAPKPVVEERPDEQRIAPRHPLIWNGTLHHDYQSDPVRVRNISSTGAMIETNGKVRVGATPLFELGDAISISAIVEWAVGDQVGLRFQEPFDVDMLAEARPTVASTSNWTPPTYLGKTVKNDDRWGRADLAELREQLEGFIRH